MATGAKRGRRPRRAKQPSERSILKEMQEHPWAGRKMAARIARDHMRGKLY